MENLPPEVLRKILLQLLKEGKGRWFHGTDEFIRITPLAGYAVISRKWQSIVEPFTFRNIDLDPVQILEAEAYNYLPPLVLLIYATYDYDDQIFFNKAVKEVFGLLARIPPRQTPLLNLTLSMSVENFKPEYIREAPRDQTFQAPSIVPANATGDILSQEIRHFLQRDGLKVVWIDASVDSTIFWPKPQNSETTTTWPTLEEVHIELNAVLPSGERIEILDIDADEEDQQVYENIAEDEMFDIEVLGEEYARSFESTYNPVHFERGYVSMGIGFTIEDRHTWKHKTSPFLEFAGCKGPEPSEETMDAWRRTLDLHELEWNDE
ncbi:hypothetical protein FSARC_14503 [Fusarium sarcochroum]|uniref:Uncharacterized protein n=1 Tax=Fusarium sarcochroum TaxID=1208366 RepID=A0A8H4WP42_9HYPO|nr:hypothetical protein FSARC_14503 [Fusarium sarcochroum]